MKVLIELYDTEDPILNVLSCLAIKPDEVIFIGEERTKKQRFQRPLKRVLEMSGLNIPLRFVSLKLTDISIAADCIADMIKEHINDECILDVTGGNDLLLLAAGMCCSKQDIQVIRHRVGSNRLRYLWGRNAGMEEEYNIRINIAQAISLSGGELQRHGHFDVADMDDSFHEMIVRMFGVYSENRQKWPRFVRYLQQTVDFQSCDEDNLWVQAPKRLYCAGHPLHADLKILGDLADIGAIEDIRVGASECSFRYTSPKIRKYLHDVGIWLELFMYSTMLQSGIFDHVDSSVVVSWDDDDEQPDTLNEVDVIATAGVGRIFISCKTAIPDNAALNEIAVLAERFGGRYAIPVMATMCDLKQEAPAILHRAMEMGISVIDADDLSPKTLTKKLETLRRRWDQ